uniref:Uncharacterized protein n=1 Tax=Neolamprologus brichardi TaxID=32507 RepID=A0A3Q4HG29_NEOBR
MSASLAAKRDKIQREVEELERSLSVTNAELELLSSGTGTHLLSLSVFIALSVYDDSDREDVDTPAGQRFVSGSLKRGSWTLAEDDLLRELVDKMRIGNFIPYTQSNHITLWNQVLDPSLKRGPWTKNSFDNRMRT